MKHEPKFRIVWRNKTTGQTGRGTRRFDRASADVLVKELNTDYPHIEHSVEEVE